MPTANEELVRSSLDAFVRGDWDELSRALDPGAEWLSHEPSNANCHDREMVLATLAERRRKGATAELHAVVTEGELVFVEVSGPGVEGWGGRACMVVSVRDGRIVRMQDYASRAAARAAAGLPPEPATEPEDDLESDPPRLHPDGALAHAVIEVIRSGKAAALERLLRDSPALATARIGDRTGGCRGPCCTS